MKGGTELLIDLIDDVPEDWLCIVKIEPHSDILRALSGEEEHHLWPLRRSAPYGAAHRQSRARGVPRERDDEILARSANDGQTIRQIGSLRGRRMADSFGGYLLVTQQHDVPSGELPQRILAGG